MNDYMGHEEVYQWVMKQVRGSTRKEVSVRVLVRLLAYDTPFDPCALDCSTYAAVRKACNRLVREGVLVRLKQYCYVRVTRR